MTIPIYQSLTVHIVKELGKSLIEIADSYPLQYLTERDFFPLVSLFLKQHLPSVTAEVSVGNGRIDFRTGGTNPAALELALAPRDFRDGNCPLLRFKGHDIKTQLHASQNKKELAKLLKATNMTNRYLLLVDLRGAHDIEKLKQSYVEVCPLDGSGCAIQVVYCSRELNPESFQVGGNKRGRKRTKG